MPVVFAGDLRPIRAEANSALSKLLAQNLLRWLVRLLSLQMP